MVKALRDLLAEARAVIPEKSPTAVAAESTRLLIDIRERDEWEAGHIPGAHHISRGYLEARIEGLVADRTRPITLYCAAGVRSLLAGVTLHEMGYDDVASMAGGYEAWQLEGHDTVVPQTLRPDQRQRYSRHLLIPEVGEAGQIKLLESKALVIGAGGLGSPAAMYLAAAGVGTIGIVDFDLVDATNLQRQLLHTTDRVGQPKTESARKTIGALNPDVNVVEHREQLTSQNAESIFAGYDLILNGCDNFPTRYLANDVAIFLRKPLVDGSIFRFDGQVTSIVPFESPCYRCRYPQPPPPSEAPSCAEAGVLGVLPGIIGSLQAAEAIKLLLGVGQPLVGRLLQFDALTMQTREFLVHRNPHCPVCSDDPQITAPIDYEQFCAVTQPRRRIYDQQSRPTIVAAS